VLEALDLTGAGEATRAVIRAYGGFASFAAREWLARRTLTRAQVHALLTRTLLALAQEIVPALPPPGMAAATHTTRPGDRLTASTGGEPRAVRD
jgi:hypothetical protein